MRILESLTASGRDLTDRDSRKAELETVTSRPLAVKLHVPLAVKPQWVCEKKLRDMTLAIQEGQWIFALHLSRIYFNWRLKGTPSEKGYFGLWMTPVGETLARDWDEIRRVFWESTVPQKIIYGLDFPVFPFKSRIEHDFFEAIEQKLEEFENLKLIHDVHGQ